MSHLAGHRLADLAAGRITGRRAARMRVHLDGCEPCRTAWQRVRSARASLGELATAAPPELHWDRIRAQIYWTVGTGSHAVVGTGSDAPDAPVGPRRSRRGWRLAPALALAGGAVALVVATRWGGGSSAPSPARSASPAAPRAPTGPAATAPGDPPGDPVAVELIDATPLIGVVTLVEGDASVSTREGGVAVERVDAAAIGATPVGAGDRLVTGEGRLAIQLGPASTVTVAPRSQLTLRSFDAHTVALVVEGQVDIAVERRAADQRFVVEAGARIVEVRGTAFQVRRRDGEVAVACEHGRVVVAGDGGQIELGAGQTVDVADDEPLLGRAPRALTAAELADLARARAASLPMWTDAATVLRTTAPLAVVAPSARAVRVDGVVIGTGPLWMRVPPGRHLVEAERSPGRFGTGRWVEVGGAGPAAPVVVEAEAPPSSASARRVRQRELTRAIDQGRIGACVRALAKQDILAGSQLELEVGVDASGAIGFLNIVRTDLPARAAGCVRDAVGAVRLGSGPAATWRHRLSF